MNYHVPVITAKWTIPAFITKGRQLVIPQNIFTQREYPNLPSDLVKITAQDGRNIYVPAHKLSGLHSQDI